MADDGSPSNPGDPEDGDLKESASVFSMNPRYEGGRVLESAGIDFCVWAEDTLSAYGVPTVTFDFYLMVDAVSPAAQALTNHGYVHKPIGNEIMPIPEFSARYGPPGAKSHQDVVLLIASEWHYDMKDTSPMRVPPLNKLVDSMFSRWTDPSSSNFMLHLAVLISYCLLYIPDVKSPEFLSRIRKENRQLYLDCIDGRAVMSLVSRPGQEHYRLVRDQIRAGDLDPVGPSDYCRIMDDFMNGRSQHRVSAEA